MNILLAVPLLLLSFIFIGVVIERHFIPSLENIAGWLKMPENVAGATLLAFGSSAPELFTSLMALFVFSSRPAFGVGNVIGSALFQILVVIGFAAMIKTTWLAWRPVVRDGAVYALSVAILFFCVRDGVFTVTEGGVLVGAYFVYLALLLLWPRMVRTRGKRGRPQGEDRAGLALKGPLAKLALVTLPAGWLLSPIPDPEEKPAWTIPVFLLSLLIIGAGTYIFVRAGEAIAGFLGIEPTIIALTIIAGGSSIPELVSSAVVARGGKGDMAIANALGSNTFDIFISLGLPVLIYTSIHGPVQNVGGANITSTTILLLATLLMVLGLLALQKFKASRLFGGMLILGYVLYLAAAYQGWIG